MDRTVALIAALLLIACGANDDGRAAEVDAGGEPDPDGGSATLGCDTTEAAGFTGSGLPVIDWTLVASGQSELFSVTPLAGGGALVLGDASGPMELGGVAIAGSDAAEPFAAWLDRDGNVTAARRLLAGTRVDRAVAIARDGDAVIAVFAVFDDVTLDPDGQALPIALPELDASYVVVAFDPGGLTWSTTITGSLDSYGAGIASGHQGGVLVYGVAGDVAITGGGAAVAAAATTAAEYPGHGFVAELAADGAPSWAVVLDGDAGSAVRGAIAFDGGRVAIGGRFGGFGPHTLSFGGDGAPSLLSASSDEDPAFDAFVALVGPGGTVAWAERILSYGGDGALPIVSAPGGFAAGVHSAAYDTVFADARPAEVRIATSDSRGVFALGGSLVLAQATAPYDLLAPRSARARLATSPWTTDQPGDLPIEIATAAPAQHEIILALGDQGEVVGARHLASSSDDASTHFRQVVPACGPRWFVAGNPYGDLTLTGADGDLALAGPVDSHIVVTALRAE